MSLLGSYSGTLDNRGRFLLPTAVFREVNSKAQGRYIVNRSTDKCVNLYPGNVWDIFKKKLDKINTFDPKKRALVRYFLGSATEISLDSKNRLLIPAPLADYAELEKNLLIVSVSPVIEIWNLQLYNQAMEAVSAANMDDITQIANDIFDDGRIFEELS
jgi:MraZ protein